MKRANLILISILAVSAMLLLGALPSAALTLDPSFGNGGTNTVPAAKGFFGTFARTAVARPGGGYLVAGSMAYDGYWEERWLVSAFTADGRLDASFGRRGSTTLSKKLGPRFLRYAAPESIKVQADGKILVGSTIDVATNSDFRAYDREIGDPECNCSASRAAFAVIRLLPNGALDASWGRGGVSVIKSVVRTWDEGLDAELADIAINPDGSAFVYGASTDVTGTGGWAGQPYGLIYRLTPAGWVDKSFGTGGRVLELYPKGTDSVSSRSLDVRADGSITTVAEAEIPFGKNGFQTNWLVRRFSPLGAPDVSYGSLGSRAITLENRGGYGLVDDHIASDGGVTLAGSLFRAQTVEGPDAKQSILARVAANGDMDAGFGAGGIARVPVRAKAGQTMLEAFAVRQDGTVDLVESYRQTLASSGQSGSVDLPDALRSVSSAGALIPDASGATESSVPGLPKGNSFFVSSIFFGGDAFTFVGSRDVQLVGQQPRITLMRARR